MPLGNCLRNAAFPVPPDEPCVQDRKVLRLARRLTRLGPARPAGVGIGLGSRGLAFSAAGWFALAPGRFSLAAAAFALPTAARAAVLLGAGFIVLAPIVGDVESTAFEDQSGTGTNCALDLPLAPPLHAAFL